MRVLMLGDVEGEQALKFKNEFRRYHYPTRGEAEHFIDFMRNQIDLVDGNGDLNALFHTSPLQAYLQMTAAGNTHTRDSAGRALEKCVDQLVSFDFVCAVFWPPTGVPGSARIHEHIVLDPCYMRLPVYHMTDQWGKPYPLDSHLFP